MPNVDEALYAAAEGLISQLSPAVEARRPYLGPIAVTPSEDALYERLAARLRQVMDRAHLSPVQMTLVADEFFRAALELVDAMPDQAPGAALLEEAPVPVEPVMVDVPNVCSACRRDLGVSRVPEELRTWVLQSRCLGCMREGR